MNKIRFLSDQVYDTGGRGKGPRFEAGSTLTLSGVSKALGHDVSKDWAEGFLHRWVKRSVAVDITNETPAERKAAEAAFDTGRQDALDAQQRVEDLLALASEKGVQIADGATEDQILTALKEAGIEAPQA